ncbi:ribosomal protein L1p/L10e family-domain-containing protein [Hyaloraphidium curvatum]|nr:ribosomal protein L1p/L10e family-domain-containing protein [Hyaloraphidium curvatum]
MANAAPPAAAAENPLDGQQVRKAVKALLAFVERRSKEKDVNELLPEADFVFVILALKKIPDKANVKPIQIPVEHPFIKEDAEICLITKDPQREYKDLLEAKGARQLVHKVLGVSKLRAKFKPYEAKRLLCKSYDLFLSDDRVIPLLPPLLGKTFFEKKKQPVSVDLTKPDLVKEITAARDATYLFFGKGSSSAIKIANTAQSAEEIVDNVMSGIPEAIAKIPRKWKNIQSIHLKTTESVAIPLYHSLPDNIATDKKKRKAVDEQQDEMKRNDDALEAAADVDGASDSGDEEFSDEDEDISLPPIVLEERQWKRTG